MSHDQRDLIKQLATGMDKIVFLRSFDDGSISVSQKLILIIIASHIGDNDFCFVSLTTLQTECCLARDKVSDNLNKLIMKGLIIKIPPSDGYKSNRYKINFENIISSQTLPVAKGYQSSSQMLPHQEPKATSLVAKGYPKEIQRNIKKIKAIASCDSSDLQITSEPQFRGEPQFTTPLNCSSLHPGTAVHPINTNNQYKRNNTNSASRKSSVDNSNQSGRNQEWGPGHLSWERMYGGKK